MKTWFITGSSSGIGKGIAKAVLEKGDNAVIMARDINGTGISGKDTVRLLGTDG